MLDCACQSPPHRCAVCNKRTVGGIAGFHACSDCFTVAYELAFAFPQASGWPHPDAKPSRRGMPEWMKDWRTMTGSRKGVLNG